MTAARCIGVEDDARGGEGLNEISMIIFGHSQAGMVAQRAGKTIPTVVFVHDRLPRAIAWELGSPRMYVTECCRM